MQINNKRETAYEKVRFCWKAKTKINITTIHGFISTQCKVRRASSWRKHKRKQRKQHTQTQ